MASAQKKKITVIHCWSAPRSRSTALLYSFEARGSHNCVALDEPLYRQWLQHHGDSVARPYHKELIQGIPPEDSPEEAEIWKRELLSLNERIQQSVEETLSDGGVIFCKHMAKHSFLYNFDKEYVHENATIDHRHMLLIRDPVDVLSAWEKVGDNHGNIATCDEVGVVPLLSIYSQLESRNNKSSNSFQPVVLESNELALDPKEALSRLCESLSIPFMESMLTWKSGPHACDGPWAKWWYKNVHKSSGWMTAKENQYYPESSKYRTLDPSLIPALKASFPAYQFLKQLTNAYKSRGPPPEKIYEDPRNANLLVWIGAPTTGRLIPRDMAGVSPWDSSVQGGDGCWEGLRVYRGKILSLDKHLRRLFRSAKALGFENVHTKEQVIDAIFRTLAANGMRDQAHMRLTLTRGEKCTSSMNPNFNVYGTTLIILPEWKPTEGATTYDNTKGITLISASQRRNSPSTCDSKIHHNNMINNILPKIQANLAKAADAIMLDLDGYVSETNATNIFMVDDEGTLLTPHADHCLPGITRATVIELAKELGIPVEVRRVSLAEFHAAEEVFTTGTMGELTPVTKIDGRVIGTGIRGPITERLQGVYKTLPERPGWATEIPPFAEG
jgi:protein-lysine N-methyltransferase EEF2KMT